MTDLDKIAQELRLEVLAITGIEVPRERLAKCLGIAIEKRIYSQVEHWRSSVEAIQEENRRLKSKLDTVQKNAVRALGGCGDDVHGEMTFEAFEAAGGLKCPLCLIEEIKRLKGE